MLRELLLDQGFAQESLPHLDRAGNVYLQGLALLELKRLLEAVDTLMAADARHPDDPELLFHLGKASSMLMQRAFTRIVTAHPDSPRALELQARNYLAQGRGDLAEPVFRSVLKMKPDMPGIHLELGRILQEQRGNLDGAEEEFRAEVRLRPGNAEAVWRVGSILLKKGQSKEALVELQRSNQLQPDMLDTLLDLGKCYVMENQLAPAEEAFRRIMRSMTRTSWGPRHFAVIADLPQARPQPGSRPASSEISSVIGRRESTVSVVTPCRRSRVHQQVQSGRLLQKKDIMRRFRSR